jgi:hypothetical protein
MARCKHHDISEQPIADLVHERTAGNVSIRVGDVSDAFNQSQPDGVWYEYNSVRQLRGNRFDRRFKTADTLKVRSGQNDVFIRVEVRQW